MSETKINEARIKARVAGRSDAEEVHESLLNLVSETFPGHGADYAEAFIDRMKELLPSRPSQQPKPDTIVPFARLGATKMPFGAHTGQTFDEAPIDYLDWLCYSQEDFYKTLRAYLTHPECESRRRLESR